MQSVAPSKLDKLQKFIDEYQSLCVLKYNRRMVSERPKHESQENPTLDEKDRDKLRVKMASMSSLRIAELKFGMSSQILDLVTASGVNPSNINDLSSHVRGAEILNDEDMQRQNEARLEIEVIKKCNLAKTELKDVLHDTPKDSSCMATDVERKELARIKKLKARIAVLENIMVLLLNNTDKLRSDERLLQILDDIVKEQS
ncbi:uncharacterized protein LOC136039507 [Artemia franciscana]|uniref:Uncharacterized protein n=1 Tax=Artemia franciscana TaxID=6661 RepID=A0AA88HZS8_ARTSF|nr:hypothetical protein QYM36_007414 [Artemia franciscana]